MGVVAVQLVGAALAVHHRASGRAVRPADVELVVAAPEPGSDEVALADERRQPVGAVAADEIRIGVARRHRVRLGSAERGCGAADPQLSLGKVDV